METAFGYLGARKSKCIKGGQIWRLKENQRIFDDEAEANKFLSMTEFNKEVSGMSYQANRPPLLELLNDIWGINTNFGRDYWCDYTMVKGNEDDRSAWCNKYTTVVFCEGDNWKGKPQQQIHCQPLPDYMRWFASGGELHYLPNGSWDTVTGCYIPSYCLDLAYILMPNLSLPNIYFGVLLCCVG